MNRSLEVTGAAVDTALAGVSGESGADVVVSLRTGERPPGAGMWLLWAADAAAAGAATADRVLAPAGRGLWRRAPWPVQEAIFDLPVPPEPPSVLVAEGDAAERSAAVDALEARGIPTTTGERLDLGVLARASIVVLCTQDGALPAAGMAPLAAGRLAVTVACKTSFGLLAGVDHLAATDARQAAALVDAALAQWDALAPMRALGRLAAERHRAPLVYERLLADLALEGDWE